jgi:5'-deoxynucleotidase YfbR-like HD superfamily hydrolase
VASRIDRKKGQLRGNHFAVLELHWVCLSKDVEDSYERLIAEFQPELFHDLTEKQVGDLTLICERLESGYTVLKEERTRRAYRKEVIESDMIQNSAELLGQKGEMAIMRKDRREACACFAKAVELVPAESLYKEGLRRATAV